MSAEALPEPAPLGRRAVAFVLDLFPMIAFHLAIGGRSWIATAAVYVLYHGILTGATGGTPGKVLLGIGIRQQPNRRLKWLFAFLRPTLGYAASAFPILGLLQVLLHARHRAWHDELFGTEVVRRSGGGAAWGILRALDRWSARLDRWLAAFLGRHRRLGRLVGFAREISFGISLVTDRQRALAFLKKRIQALRSPSADRAGAGGGGGQVASGGVGAVAAAEVGASAAPAVGGALAAGAAGTAVSTSLASAAAVVATASALAVGSLVAYDAVAPEALRPWVPSTYIDGVKVSGKNILILEDHSGSMRPHEAKRDALVDRLQEAGIDAKRMRIDGPETWTLLFALEENIASGVDLDAVYVISDFDYTSSPVPESSERLERLLDRHSLKLYLGTVDEEPLEAVVSLAHESGGGRIRMSGPLTF